MRGRSAVCTMPGCVRSGTMREVDWRRSSRECARARWKSSDKSLQTKSHKVFAWVTQKVCKWYNMIHTHLISFDYKPFWFTEKFNNRLYNQSKYFDWRNIFYSYARYINVSDIIKRPRNTAHLKSKPVNSILTRFALPQINVNESTRYFRSSAISSEGKSTITFLGLITVVVRQTVLSTQVVG